MKKITKKLVYLGLLSSIMVFAVGCSKSDDKKNNETSTKQEEKGTDEKGTEADNKLFEKEVVSVGDKKVSYSEAMAYFKSFQAQVEKT